MNNTILLAMLFFSFLGFIGLIFFIIGIVFLKNRKKKEVNCTSITFGKVIDIVKHRDCNSDGGYTFNWHPVFEYSIENSKFVKESIYGSSQPKYSIGQDIKIYYNPNNHNEFYVVGETIQKTLGIIFTIFGIVGITLAIFFALLIL